MSRTLRPLVLLLGLVALPVLAAESLTEGTNCPGRKVVDESSAGADNAEVRNAGAAATTTPRASGGEAAAGNQRVRPRWQSFLPGMIR